MRRVSSFVLCAALVFVCIPFFPEEADASAARAPSSSERYIGEEVALRVSAIETRLGDIEAQMQILEMERQHLMRERTGLMAPHLGAGSGNPPRSAASGEGSGGPSPFGAFVPSSRASLPPPGALLSGSAAAAPAAAPPAAAEAAAGSSSAASFLGAPIRIQPYKSSFLFTDYRNGRSAQYGHNLPQAPIFHPYHVRYPVQCPLNIKFPVTQYDRIPQKIRTTLATAGIAPGNVDILFVAQNMPVRNEDLLFRPHYWVFPNAPYQSATSLNQGASVTADMLRPDQPIVLSSNGISVHNSLPDRNVVSSPSSSSIVLLNAPSAATKEASFKERSWALWTVVISGRRAAATLHWLLHDRDYDQLQRALDALSVSAATSASFSTGQATLSLGALIEHLCSTKFSTKDLAKELQALTLRS